MKTLIAVVVMLTMSGTVMADSIATIDGTPWAWAVIDEDVYLCFREKQHGKVEGRGKKSGSAEYDYSEYLDGYEKPAPKPFCYKAEMVD
jgi:hypothetical protein|tara:strand:- start:173 stop:439 length:267 start_codon:yes stop_codon:yes gene_type:complete